MVDKRSLYWDPRVIELQAKIESLQYERDNIERKSKVKPDTNKRNAAYKKLSQDNAVYVHGMQQIEKIRKALYSQLMENIFQN